MNRRFVDDDDAQVDGEEAPGQYAVQYQARGAGQPWLRGSLPPWHLWGNTEQVTITTGAFGTASIQTKQLNKVGYKRPESWHWFFGAKLVAGPTPSSPQEAGIRVHIDVTIGMGRSVYIIPDFEVFQWVWSDPGGGTLPDPPLGVLLYSTEAIGPNRSFNNDAAPTPIANRINQLVAQDIQVQARIEAIGNFPATYVVDVSGFWSPKTHIRPDWLQVGTVPEAMFGGEEVGGR